MTLYVRGLSINDVRDCFELENQALRDPRDRCSLEKFEYRLSACADLCFGLLSTSKCSNPRNDGLLHAYVICTRTFTSRITDKRMAIGSLDATDSHLGHNRDGAMMAIYVLASALDLPGYRVGSSLLSAFWLTLKPSI
jgi:hypothetical protein